MSTIFNRVPVALCVAVAVGCSSGPSRPETPTWSPSGFADAILDELDKDDNDVVDSAELTAAPGLAAGGRFIDTDGDGQLSREEFESRFEMYREMRIGMKPKLFRISYNGRPLQNAEVRLLPEFFLAGVVKPATGTTDSMGIVQPVIEGEKLAGMQVGYFRVEVRSAQMQLPAEFNTATTLGVEVSPIYDDPSTDGTIEIRMVDQKRGQR